MACISGKCGGSARKSGFAKETAKTVNLLPPEEAKDFSTLSASSDKVRSGNGQYYSIGKPLVKIKPPSGWGIHVRVKGHIHFVASTTAEATVKAIVKLYEDNGIAVDPINVWFGSNMDWLKQVSSRHWYTTLRDLEAMRRGGDPPGTGLAVGSQPYPPQVWGAKGWGILQVLLASDAYTPKRFLEATRVLVALLADERTGCEECHKHFAAALEEFRKKPRDLTYAREWLFRVMNENRVMQGRSGFPWDHARQVNRWFDIKTPDEG